MSSMLRSPSKLPFILESMNLELGMPEMYFVSESETAELGGELRLGSGADGANEVEEEERSETLLLDAFPLPPLLLLLLERLLRGREPEDRAKRGKKQ